MVVVYYAVCACLVDGNVGVQLTSVGAYEEEARGV